ncbi:MAG TPA: glutathione S-transferase family protein [Steroidobacteraceae bacterium]|nr:glutathione S-transferase family protein [Steroidobacteraceae bacterium]
MQSLVLYNAPQSTCSQRVRFTLHEKGLSFSELKLDLFSGDQLRPEYLKINPNGVVPSLVHDGKVIIDSAVIIEYLSEVFPEPPRLVPHDPVARAAMRSLIRYIDEVPTPAVRVPSYNIAFLPHYRDMPEADFAALAESKPLRKEFLLSMGRTGFSAEEMDKALERLRRAIARMSETLRASGGPWLMGPDLTLADIAIMPVLVRMADLGLGTIWERQPEVARWLAAFRARPAYSKTFYFGSLLTEKYPDLKIS